MLKPHLRYVIFAIALFSLAACSSTNPEFNTPEGKGETPFSQAPSENPYPAGGETPETESSAYPAPLPEALNTKPYPAPALTGLPAQGTQFKIDTPVTEGATQITGTGVAGTFLNVIDVSMNGMNLGSGVVDDNNEFEI